MYVFFKYYLILVKTSCLQLTVQHTEAAIKSIEMQLVRVETCGCAEGYSRDGNFNFFLCVNIC